MAEVVKLLLANQDAAIAALERNDMAAYRALAEQEARLVDALRVGF